MADFLIATSPFWLVGSFLLLRWLLADFPEDGRP